MYSHSYSKLLLRSKLRKREKRQKGNVSLNLQIDAYYSKWLYSWWTSKIEIYKRIREIQVLKKIMNCCKTNWLIVSDVVAYLLEIGFIKSYLDQVFVKVVDRKDNQLTVKFDNYQATFFWLRLFLLPYQQLI